MASTKFGVRFCVSRVGCDGEVTHAKDSVCTQCKDRLERIARNKREYERVQALVAQAERNGRRDTQEAR